MQLSPNISLSTTKPYKSIPLLVTSSSSQLHWLQSSSPVVRPSVSFTLRETLRFPKALSVCLSAQVKVCSRARSMAGSQQKALAMAGVCTLLVLTFLASDVNAACSIAQLNQCTTSVTKGSTPTPACCAQVAGINDFNCFCNMLLSQRNVPQSMINNAVRVPMKCGAQGVKLRNRQCGRTLIP